MILRNELDRARFVRKLNTSPIKDAAGHYLEVLVQRKKPKRSLPQNSLLHAWIHLLAIHSGTTNAEMKRDLKRELLPVTWRNNPFTGEAVEVLTETHKLPKLAMAEFMSRIEILAVEHFGLTLPRPNSPEEWEQALHLLLEAV